MYITDIFIRSRMSAKRLSEWRGTWNGWRPWCEPGLLSPCLRGALKHRQSKILSKCWRLSLHKGGCSSSMSMMERYLCGWIPNIRFENNTALRMVERFQVVWKPYQTKSVALRRSIQLFFPGHETRENPVRLKDWRIELQHTVVDWQCYTRPGLY